MPKSKMSANIAKVKPTKQEGPPALGRPPVGMMWVYNRLSKPYSVTFDGNEEPWDGHEYRMVHMTLADHAVRKSVYKLDPLGLNNVMALVDSDDKAFGIPLPAKVEEKGNELLMRDGQVAPKDVAEVEVEG